MTARGPVRMAAEHAALDHDSSTNFDSGVWASSCETAPTLIFAVVSLSLSVLPHSVSAMFHSFLQLEPSSKATWGHAMEFGILALPFAGFY